MRLKKIKPGTVICCKNNAEWNELEDHFENMGWDERDYIRRLDHSTVIHIDGFNEVRWENKSNIVNGSDITYFSDLIIPELTAAEVLRICNEMCHNGAPCSDCKIAGNCFFLKKIRIIRKLLKSAKNGKLTTRRKSLSLSGWTSAGLSRYTMAGRKSACTKRISQNIGRSLQ